jgi:hypothetical protein
MKKIALVVLTFTFLYACSSSSSDGESQSDNFNRTEMLTNWADNIIIPGYSDYQSKLQTLSADVATFNATPTEANLQTVRTSWINAYKVYQKIAVFSIGKAMEINFNEATNTYPTEVAGIEANIASGTYNLDLLSQFSKQGFPALDYMLNGLGSTDATIVTFYSTNANAAQYKQYLTSITAKLKSNADSILTDWNTGYRDTFISSNGTGVSSSVSKTTNLFVKNFEKTIRTGKIGIPAGVFSNGSLFPEKVEAVYKKDLSKELLNTSIQAQLDFFNGKFYNSTTTGSSLKSYLDYLNAVRSGQNLSTVITNQFATIFATNTNLSNNFFEQVSNDNSKMLASYDAMQQNVVYLKLDMMQALNVTVDYVDGDGD